MQGSCTPAIISADVFVLKDCWRSFAVMCAC